MSLFSQQTYAPLAARMRPVSLDEYVGQSHLVGPGGRYAKCSSRLIVIPWCYGGHQAPVKLPWQN